MNWRQRRNERTRGMKYIVKFKATEARKFALFYVAFVSGGNALADTQRKDMEQLRREVAVLDLLWAISDGPEEGSHDRTLREGDQEMVLDKPQYDLCARYLQAFCSVVKTTAAHQALALVDWFDALQQVDGPLKKVKATR